MDFKLKGSCIKREVNKKKMGPRLTEVLTVVCSKLVQEN